MSNKTTSTTTPSSGSGKVYSAQADNVHVKSVVQTETQSMVSPTHLQDDEYSHKLTEEIYEAVLGPIKIVVGETQLQQQQLLADTNLQIQNDFKRKLPQHIAKLDSEKKLNIQQERILKSAHKCVNDDLYEDNCLKLRRYVVVVPVPAVPTAELAPAVPTAEPFPVEPRCDRHYFTCGIIIGLLIGIIIMKVVK
ncbi:unnamed protein product [Rotaria sp. Silwood2]|nr:unnamed protein product [Rotaria sp. Silwood2]